MGLQGALINLTKLVRWMPREDYNLQSQGFAGVRGGILTY